MTCEFCQALSGRFNAHRECCQVRQLTGAPAHIRNAAYARTRTEGGEKALAELKQKVRAEYQRQQGIKQARARLELDRQTAKGRAEVGALLNTMKELNMNLPPADRPKAKECA
jgi:hypothetical protein